MVWVLFSYLKISQIEVLNWSLKCDVLLKFERGYFIFLIDLTVVNLN